MKCFRRESTSYAFVVTTADTQDRSSNLLKTLKTATKEETWNS